ncbi:MAG: ATP-grasp domain-containing protein [Saprospiraceae bacterium]|nr:ATP-grasp domain-containing protein [Saprospiraceae bacterium]
MHSRRTGIGIIRSLGKKGVDVYAADLYKAEGFYSRYTKKGFVVPNMIHDGSEKLLQALIDIAKEIDPARQGVYIFSGSDDYIIFFVKHWQALQAYYRPSFETDEKKLLACIEKTTMYHLAESAGVTVPQTWYSPVRAEEVAYPAIIKPTVKRTETVDVLFEAFRIEHADTPDQMKEHIAKLDRIKVPYVVQQYIPGGDDALYTVGLFAFKGQVLAIGTGRKLRQFPPNLGECSLGELLEVPELIDPSIAFLKEAGITTISQIEFKKHEDKYYLMEINARPWAWHDLFEYAGLNLSYLALETIDRGAPMSDTVLRFKKKKGRWMYPSMDLKYNVLSNGNRSFLGFLKDFFTTHRHAFWTWRDPIPFFVHGYYAYYYEFVLPRKKKRV